MEYLANSEDLTTVANAIRTKGGTTEPLSFPNGMAQAIADISGEIDAGDWTHVTKWQPTFSASGVNAPLPETIIFDASSVSSTLSKVFDLPSSWSDDYGYRHIIIKNSNKHPFSLNTLFQNYYPTGVSDLTCTFEDGMTVANVSQALQYIGYNSGFQKIYGEIDLSLLDGTKYYGEQNSCFAHIEFKPNTLHCSLSFTSASFRVHVYNDVIISIANSLNETVSSQTIALYSSLKLKCSTIIGNVALDVSGTYHVFTEDESGTVTLADFITQTKGWTLA